MNDDRLYEEIRYELKDLKTAILVGSYFSQKDLPHAEKTLDELESLAWTYGFETLHKIPCLLKKIDASTFIGKGKVEEIALLEGDVVIFDDEISPKQQRNLEKKTGKPVIDRRELILEVFAQRAQTREARLQIELAKVRYQLPRLRRLWTHLSRQSQGGGGGYLKGEGERQIEIDRRLLKRRITQLKREIEEVKRQRSVQRAKRMKSGVPTFAIVGYTNAGKSTLMNALTQAGVFVEDKLFATLDTTTRKYTLPNHQSILLVDTVGFIRKIPHTLVAAFKSTLEESVYTDALLHVVDISDPLAEEHAEETMKVLQELGVEKKPVITILNKTDKIKAKVVLHKFRAKYSNTVGISAKTREGFDLLLEKMEETLKKLRTSVKLRIPQANFKLVSLIMEKGHVLSMDYEGNDVMIEAEIPQEVSSKVAPYVLAEV